MADQKLVLGYWGIRGLAQPLRFLLEYLELPYEEKRYSTMEEWFGGDLQKEPFNKHNLVNLPYLKDGERYIYESGAIYVYLAHRAGKPELLGRDAKEQVIAAQARGVIQDLMKAFFTVITLPEAEYNEKGLQSFKTDAGWLLERLNKFLENKTYVTGDHICTIDFGLLEVAETLFHFNKELYSAHPNIVKHHETMTNLPRIKAYLASKEFIERPFYPPGGRFRWG